MHTNSYSNQYTREALAYSSNRRSGLIRLIGDICVALGARPVPTESVTECFNKLHSAASILDDLVDNEVLRAGKPAFHRRHPVGVAAITSVHLLLDGLQDCLLLGLNDKQVMHRLMEIARSEEADVGMIRKDSSYSHLGWYLEVTSRKTSHELLLLLDLLSQGLEHRRGEDLRAFQEVVSELGLLLQLANDWRDWFENDPFYRVASDDLFVLTNNVAVAMYCEREEGKLADMIGHRFDRNEIAPLVTSVVGKSNRSACLSLILSHIEQLKEKLALPRMHFLEPLVAIVDTQLLMQFWRDDDSKCYAA